MYSMAGVHLTSWAQDTTFRHKSHVTTHSHALPTKFSNAGGVKGNGHAAVFTIAAVHSRKVVSARIRGYHPCAIGMDLTLKR